MPNITCDYCFPSVDEFKMVKEKVLSDQEIENTTLFSFTNPNVK
jgi:molybdenum cofactor biosynthesis enzyme MoaA